MSIETPKGTDANLIHLRNVVSKFGQGAFYIYNNGRQSITHNGGITKLTMDTEVIDLNSWVDTSVYTPKQPGYYLLFAECSILAADNTDFTTLSDTFKLYIRKNGATPTEYSITSSYNKGVERTLIVEANGTTDYFDVAGIFVGSAGEAIYVSHTRFGGVFVSYNNP